MKRFFRRSAPKPGSSNQALGSSPTSDPSKQALGPSILADVPNARVDIIFLHGLTGHRERTWTATGENEPWTKSLLPKDLPTARIITYGYDADVVNLTRVAGQNTVREHSTNLINDIAALRRDAVGRPIIFVAHSLGGLVCQDALLVCNNPNEEAQSDILSSTCGIAFLGTPHAGSDLETFATAVANIVSLVKTPNKKLLKVLSSNSEVLANIENGFLTMVQRRLGDRQSNLKPIALHSFIEEMPVDFLGRRVVEPDSAKIRGYNFDTIHANHMEMTKFGTAADAGYAKVLNRLKSWIDGDEGLQYADKLRLEFETLWPGMELANSEPPVSAKQLCKSPDIELSLGWFLSSWEYQSWQQMNSDTLWLHGEHGDGKTVIMTYILRSPSLHPRDVNEQDIVSIFCSYNDSEEGVAASIAMQLLQNKDSLSNLSIPKFQPGYGRPDYNRVLWGLLKVLIVASPPIVLIIDGIDKLEISTRMSFLDRLVKLEKDVEKNGKYLLRVLISSDNSDDIQRVLHYYSSIDREKERRECLKTLEFQEWNAREIAIQEVEAAGKRFFCHPEYRSWVQCDEPSVLWLEGKPGSGKSTLAKFMVQKLEKDTSLEKAKQRDPFLNSPQKGKEEWVFNNPADKRAIIARFYYSFRGGNTQTSHELMLRSIVYQIWSENSRLFPLIRDRYRELKEAREEGERSLWSYDDLKWALESLREVAFDLSVFIIVDGMDESNNDVRGDVLKLLLDLARPNPKGSCMLKVFIASRPENNINSRLQLVPRHIKLQQVNEEDIRVVVEGWIERMVSEGECEEETLLEVKDYVTAYSDGVFMWVTLVLRDLERYIGNGGYTKFSLNARLRSLPKELGGKDGFYWAMIYSLVENYKEDQEQQERGQRILAWVTFAERPILVTELRDALATPSKLQGTNLSTYVLENNRPHQLYKAILSSCGGLAEVRDSPSGEIVQLIHQTAREFLLHKDKHAGPYHLDEVQGDMEIATACCRYLRIVFRPDFPPPEAKAKLTKVEKIVRHLSDKSLLMYALANFQVHLNHLGRRDEKIRDEFTNFVKLLNKRSNSYAHLLLGQWIEALQWSAGLDVDDTSVRLCLHALLLCAVEIREEAFAQVLVSLRPDLLHIEAGKGNLVTIKRLHENPPHPVSQIIGGWIPIRGEDEHEDGFRLLLDIGVHVNLKDTFGRTPISYAAENCQERGLEMLIQRGAYADAEDWAGRTPLSYAAEKGYKSGVKILLERGANIESEDSAGRTPLSYAAENGQGRIIQELAEKGAEIDSKDSAGRTPISYAAENGYKRSVNLLLECGADVEWEDSAGRTPLSYAAENGQGRIILELAEKGAEIDSKDSAGRTPLSYAAENGHESSLTRLIEKGANVNSKDRAGRTPLSYATDNCHGAVAKLLQLHTI